MTRIHGSVFVIIGLVVSVVSYLLEHLFAFLYVGIVFIFYGLIKLIFFSSKKEKSQTQNPHLQPNQSNQKYQQQQYPQLKPNVKVHYHPQTNYQYVICPSCGYHMHTSYRFCPRCGYEVHK